MKIFTTERKANVLSRADKKTINSMYPDVKDPTQPLVIISIATCRVARKPENRLVFIMAYAICSALSLKKSAWEVALVGGRSKDTAGEDTDSDFGFHDANTHVYEPLEGEDEEAKKSGGGDTSGGASGSGSGQAKAGDGKAADAGKFYCRSKDTLL